MVAAGLSHPLHTCVVVSRLWGTLPVGQWVYRLYTIDASMVRSSLDPAVLSLSSGVIKISLRRGKTKQI